MSEYFESEEITKGYDPEIMKRILGYVKPYWKSLLIAGIALALSTVGELLIPLIVQKTVDEALVVSWEALDVSKISNATKKSLSITDEEIEIEGKIYISSKRLSAINQKQQAELKDSTALNTEKFYLIDKNKNPELQDFILSKESFFIQSTSHAVIKLNDMKSWSGSDILKLRAQDASFIVSEAIFLIIVLVIVLGTTFFQVWLTSLIGQKVMKDIRLDLFNHTLKQSLDFFGKQPVGRLVTRLTSDVETINEFFTSVIVSFLKDASVMFGVIVTLLGLSPQLGFITLLTLPPVVILTMISRVRARNVFRAQRKAVSKVNSYLSEHISGIQVVKLFAREKKSIEEFKKNNAELTKANIGEMYLFAVFRPLIDLLSSISMVVIIISGGLLYLNYAISLGVLIAFINLIRMFYSPVMDISEKYTILQSAMAGGERVFKLLDEKNIIPNTGEHLLPATLKGKIEFKNVSFAYKKNEEVLKDLTFTVQEGTMAAIVGYTGSGKTTITNLITRLWDIEKGTILIDGIDIKDIRLNDLRTRVQSVLQDVFLFSGTIEENIRLGREMTDEEVLNATKTVYAHDFISKLPLGYKTPLSEGATNLSAGQRQLLSFARVVAYNPDILILDEATSNIDTETEKLVQKGLEALLKGRTSIVIAHRLSTIRHASQILVLGSGKILEAGTHDDLLKSEGIYYNLHQIQYSKEEHS